MIEERPRVEGLSIVMPACDEEANILEAIDLARRAGERYTDDLEIVIVDDGSRDRTAERVEAEARNDPRVRLVRHERNRGYGGAFRSALGAATKPWVFLTDSDLQFDLEEIGGFLTLRGEYPIVIGYRSDRKDHWMRRVNAWGWARAQRVVFGLRVRDVDCAFKLFRRDVLDSILPLRSEGAFVSAELLVKAKARGFHWAQVPVGHHPRRAGSPTGARIGVILRAFWEMWELRRDLKHESPKSNSARG